MVKHHLERVRRLRTGDPITVGDGAVVDGFWIQQGQAAAPGGGGALVDGAAMKRGVIARLTPEGGFDMGFGPEGYHALPQNPGLGAGGPSDIRALLLLPDDSLLTSEPRSWLAPRFTASGRIQS